MVTFDFIYNELLVGFDKLNIVAFMALLEPFSMTSLLSFFSLSLSFYLCLASLRYMCVCVFACVLPEM